MSRYFINDDKNIKDDNRLGLAPVGI